MDKLHPALLIDHLRSVTWHRHEAFERLPFVTALKDGTLPLNSYVAQLRGLAAIFAALEQSLVQSQLSIGERASKLLKFRFDLLCSDLAFFSPRLLPDILPSVKCALECARNIRLLSATSPAKLLGYLYVAQGTIKGNQVHLPDIIRCFDLSGEQGSAFYRGYGSSTEEQWNEFRMLMCKVGEDDAADALLGVHEIYDALEQFHLALYPIPEDGLGFTATGLNPEAGDHSVPQNPALIQAALRAGRRCRDEFSYYERRYGERGRRFTDSDAAWLAALTTESFAVISDQVLWLGRVLSARGMPFLLMERQLEILAEELGALGSNVSLVALMEVLSNLQHLRNQLMSQNVFDEKCRALSSSISSPPALDFVDLPWIIVAAHLDAQAGIPECTASLFSWLKDNCILSNDEIATIFGILD